MSRAWLLEQMARDLVSTGLRWCGETKLMYAVLQQAVTDAYLADLPRGEKRSKRRRIRRDARRFLTAPGDPDRAFVCHHLGLSSDRIRDLAVEALGGA